MLDPTQERVLLIRPPEAAAIAASAWVYGRTPPEGVRSELWIEILAGEVAAIPEHEFAILAGALPSMLEDLGQVRQAMSPRLYRMLDR